MPYTPPLKTQLFLFKTIAGLEALQTLPGLEEGSAELAESLLAESGKFAAEVLAPTNRSGDKEGARLKDGLVTLPADGAQALQQYLAAGWVGLSAPKDFGGAGLPFLFAAAVGEQMASANLSLSLCPLLTMGAIEALKAHGSPTQKETFLRPLIAGRWTGTMNLTEPQAGSDVGALRSTATPATDGSWRLKGQKIFITWGEHSLSENILHLVLARTPGAPAGSKGISLFLVPKFLPDETGAFTRPNDLRCVALEEKLGIHASPTCTMAYGDHDNCVGWLLGREQGGMKAMFTMMNYARVGVGIEGVAIAERATQAALAYARERIQSPKIGGSTPVPIIEHADVQRLLLTCRALTDAARAIAYYNAAAIDRAAASPDKDAQNAAKGLADLLTPITKAFGTDTGVAVASLALQVFGGAGYIEETGAAQYYRDARITPIYEGTNGIQALDLVGRKLGLDAGKPVAALLQKLAELPPQLANTPLADLAPALSTALQALTGATRFLQEETLGRRAASATPYLRMFALTLGGFLLAETALAASQERATPEADIPFLDERIAVARWYAAQILPAATALVGPITSSAAALAAAAPALTLP